MKRISTAVLALLMVLALLPITAEARVNIFSETPPGGGGTGGGVAEAAPRGFAIDVNGKEAGGLTWLSSGYDNYNWCAVFTGATNGLSEEIPAVDADGNPIIYYLNAYVDRNPGTISGNTAADPEPYIILYKDGVRVPLSGKITDGGVEVNKVGYQTRGAADRAGNMADPSGQTGRWTVPMTLTFEPGHTYEFAFAQGFVCNNGVANMVSEDGTGYYQNISADPTNAERLYYEAHKHDESKYREYKYQTYKPSATAGGTAVYVDGDHVNPTVGTFHPMRFTLKTKAIAVTGVTVDLADPVLEPGAQVTLTATVAPENAENKNVLWTSSDSAVAEVSPDGTVTGVSPGIATITATTEDGGYTAVITVTVPGIILKNTVASMTVGKEALVSADCFGEAGTRYVWTSSDESVVTAESPATALQQGEQVAATALLKANGPGTATVTVATEDGAYAQTFDVTVSPKDAGPVPPVVTPPEPGTNTPGTPGTVAKVPSKNPKTGDESLLASALMLLIAAGAVGARTLDNRRKEH